MAIIAIMEKKMETTVEQGLLNIRGTPPFLGVTGIRITASWDLQWGPCLLWRYGNHVFHPIDFPSDSPLVTILLIAALNP